MPSHSKEYIFYKSIYKSWVDPTKTKKLDFFIQKKQNTLIKVAQVEGLFKKDVFDTLANPEGAISLSSARETLSTISKLIREKELGLAAGESVDVGRLKFLKNAFTEQVRKNAGKEYLDELQKFNDLNFKVNKI